MSRSIEFLTTAAVALTGRRRVCVSLQSRSIKDGREFNFTNGLTEHGLPPSEVVVESWVSYNRNSVPELGIHTPVQDDELAYRSPDMPWGVNEALVDPNRPLGSFEGDVTQQGQTSPISTQYADAVLKVHVVSLY